MAARERYDQMRTLERMHPLCCFLYMLAVLGVTIFTRSPILIAESALGAVLLMVVSDKGKLALLFPVIVVISAVTNPLFSHNGVTVLFFAGDIPFTAEAVLYGALFGLMLAAVSGWSISSIRYITSDKYIWLFGRILPTSGLVLSCGLRFVPLFIRRTKSFAAAQSSESLREHLRAFSSAVGYSAEEAMSSADSMKARGYGCAKRTSYSLYRLGKRESTVLFTVILLAASAVSLMVLGGGEFYFYPALSAVGNDINDILLYIVFGVLCILPTFAVIRENLKRRCGYSVLKEI